MGSVSGLCIHHFFIIIAQNGKNATKSGRLVAARIEKLPAKQSLTTLHLDCNFSVRVFVKCSSIGFAVHCDLVFSVEASEACLTI